MKTPNPKMQRFKHWFTEYFWYYYKTPIIIGAVVLFSFILVLKLSIVPDPDIKITTATPYYFSEEILEYMESDLLTVVKDVSGDGIVSIQANPIMIGDNSTDMSSTADQKVALSFLDGETTLYIIDDEVYQIYLAQDGFEKLENYGIDPAETDDGYSIVVSAAAVIGEDAIDTTFRLAMRAKQNGKTGEKIEPLMQSAALAIQHYIDEDAKLGNR